MKVPNGYEKKKTGEIKMKENKTKRSYEIDMCSGPLFSKIVLFALPLMASGVLQLLFNAADIIVVGRFAGSQSMAAVGSNGSLINLMVNVFIGLSIGANVLVARYYGARDEKNLEETVHTAMVIAVVGGLLLIAVGELLTKPILILMGSPEDVLPLAVLYMKIYFLGMPGTLVYNFGSAILRAVGDTRRPLYFLLTAGVVNVIFNLIFVIAFSMDVAGVGWATVISQYISAALVLRCLIQTEADYRLELSKLRVVKHKLCAIIQIGLPAGLQGAIFSISNVLIQSSINSFGSVAMAGSTASSNIEGFVYTAMNAIYQTALSFTSQNYGVGKWKRMDRVLIDCLILSFVAMMILGNSAYFFGPKLLTIYTSNSKVIQCGMEILLYTTVTYFLCGFMDLFPGALRGMGRSGVPMILSIIGTVGTRIVWIFWIFPNHRSLDILFISYPASWIITIVLQVICYYFVRKQLYAKMRAEA